MEPFRTTRHNYTINRHQIIYRWTLFLPSATPHNDNALAGVSEGQWVHIDLITSHTAPLSPTPPAKIPEMEVREVGKRVHTRGGFKILGRKDEQFCVDVVEELHRLNPESVPALAVEDAMKPSREMSDKFIRKRTQAQHRLQAEALNSERRESVEGSC